MVCCRGAAHRNRTDPAGNYMFKVSNRNARTGCEICSKLTIKTPGGVLLSYEF